MIEFMFKDTKLINSSNYIDYDVYFKLLQSKCYANMDTATISKSQHHKTIMLEDHKTTNSQDYKIKDHKIARLSHLITFGLWEKF